MEDCSISSHVVIHQALRQNTGSPEGDMKKTKQNRIAWNARCYALLGEDNRIDFDLEVHHSNQDSSIRATMIEHEEKCAFNGQFFSPVDSSISNLYLCKTKW